MNWKYFGFAAFLVGAALLKAGAPFAPVVAGIAGCALWNLARHRPRRIV